LLDTIPLPHIGESAEVSPDGRCRYTALWRYNDPPYGHYTAKMGRTSAAQKSPLSRRKSFGTCVCFSDHLPMRVGDAPRGAILTLC
jgi:hypothetical protein